jgi:hypothetical protein
LLLSGSGSFSFSFARFLITSLGVGGNSAT